LGEDAAIKLHKCPNENWFPKWTKLLNRVKHQGFVLRERPFNLNEWGDMLFFSKILFSFPMLLKKYSDFGGGKKNNLIQTYN
jgi:hypothetical protein